MTGVFIVEAIRIRSDNSPHEREARRKGQRVNVLQLEAGRNLIAEYIDDPGYVLRTSTVEEWEISHASGLLTVTTENTVYTFRKEVAE